MRRLVAALACRAGGSRLYGKPLQLLDVERGVTVLEYMLDLIGIVPEINETVLGVCVGPENEPFHEIAGRRELRSIRGDEVDVLQRLIQCGEAGNATDVFRVTTESPFTYFEAIPDAWARHQEHGNDVTHVTDLPDGSGFELITFETLRCCHDKGEARHRSELCTLYVRDHQDDFRVEVIEPPAAVRRPDIRLTIDYPEDLVLCRRVYERFRDLAPKIPVADIVHFLDDEQPELKALVERYSEGLRWYA
jgi:spore coat polysaccharide biosynthesis protein SpsF